MLKAINIIKAINKALEPFLIMDSRGSFVLELSESNNIYRLRPSEFKSTAIDNYRNDQRNVSVERWFNDYWIFIEIIFLNYKGIRISISLFQGEANDLEKNQLFRAEWDDYGDETMTHPQPHWHFLPNRKIEKTVDRFAEMISEGDTFQQLLEENEIIDLSNFHFAMNGDWSNSSKYIHTINSEKELSNWFGGFFAYLKQELKYIDKREASLSSFGRSD